MDNIDLKLVIGLHRLINTVDRNTARVVKEYDLTMGQFAVLEALVHKGQQTVGQVQDRILSTTGTIPVIVNNLERRGYITKRQDPKDKRRTLLKATRQGIALMEEVFPKNVDSIEGDFACFSQEEKETLLALLKKFRDASQNK